MGRTISDTVLLDRLAGGEATALNEIYLLYWQELFVSAYNVLKDKAVCEDMLQDLFLQLWQRRASLQITISLRAYLFAAVRYNVFRYIRSGRGRIALFSDIEERMEMPAADYLLEEKELHRKVARAVAGLPAKCREIYILSREEQLSHKEIASRLNVSTKTVENHITIALKRVRFSLNALLLLLQFLVSMIF